MTPVKMRERRRIHGRKLKRNMGGSKNKKVGKSQYGPSSTKSERKGGKSVGHCSEVV